MSSLLSSSLLTTSTSSSLPAQKYLNTRDQRPPQTDDNDLRTAKPHPPVLTHPLRELPLNPEDDILYQWRLQRRLEEARREAAMAGEEGGVFELRRENGRWRGDLGPPPTHMHTLHSVTTAQNRQCYSGAEIDTTPPAELVRWPHGISQQPSGCTCTRSLHQIGPPALHHPHLHSSHTHIPPHKHTLCDIVQCPCCSIAGESRPVEGVTGDGVEGVTGDGVEGVTGDGVEGVTSDGVEGVTGDESPECLDPSGVHVELQVRPPEAKYAQVEPPGVQGATSVYMNQMPLAGRCGAEATAREVHVAAKRSVQCARERDTKTEMKVTCESELTTQHGREELPLVGRGGGGGGGGGQGRPPVQYPSSPVLVRPRDPLHQQTTLSDSGSGDEDSQLSLTFSSEFERTLTPRSAAPQIRTEHNETSTPNIKPVLSQVLHVTVM